jgi:hypothetical protein
MELEIFSLKVSAVFQPVGCFYKIAGLYKLLEKSKCLVNITQLEIRKIKLES